MNGRFRCRSGVPSEAAVASKTFGISQRSSQNAESDIWSSGRIDYHCRRRIDGTGALLYEAKDTLYGLGYYDVRVERASLPYSFNACKRGVRFHIHVNWYGDLVQVDEIGPCGDGGYRGYDDRPYRSYRYGRDY
jgi:hypothetical protein